MNPSTNNLILTAILPIIQSTIPQVVAPVGTDDHQELVQDAIVSACQMADSMVRSGKKVLPNSIAYYAIQRAKSGRRSYSGKRSDALSTATVIDGNSIPFSMEEPVNDKLESDTLFFGDIIADNSDDPSMQVARVMDWDDFHSSLPVKQRRLLSCLIKGERPKEIAEKLKVSPARITQMKREIADKLKEFMGEDILGESTRPSVWQRDLHNRRELAASRISN